MSKAHPLKGTKPALSHGTAQAYVDWLATRRRADETIKAYLKTLQQLVDWYGAAIPYDELDEIGAAWLNHNSEKWAAKTIRMRFSVIKGFARWADDKYSEVLEDYMPPREDVTPPDIFPNLTDDIDRIVAAAKSPRQAVLFALCGYLGLRVHEAMETTPAKVHGQRLEVDGKGHKKRWLPIPQHVAVVLAAAHPGDDHTPYVAISYRTALRWTRDTCAELGLDAGGGTHTFRRTAATAMYRQTNGDINLVRFFLGHANIRMTQRYIAADWDALVQALERPTAA